MRQIVEKDNPFIQVNTNWVSDEKFHDVRMNLRLLFPLEDYIRSQANILSRMMKDRLITNPSKNSLQYRLDSMYGSKMNVTTYSLGAFQCIDISLRSISGRFVKENLFYQQLSLLSDIVHKPLLDRNSFLEAKRNFRLSHKRLEDRHADKAMMNALSIAGEKQSLGKSSLGSMKDFNHITLDDIISFHNTLIENSYKHLTIVGDVKKQSLEPYFKELDKKEKHIVYNPSYFDSAFIEGFHPEEQTNLIQLYPMNIDSKNELYYAYMVYVAYLGQGANSQLFKIIREEKSFAYSIYASRFIFDGVMLIQTSIDDRNLEKTVNAIDLIIKNSQKKIDDLSSVKRMMVANLLSVNENPAALSVRSFYQDIMKKADSINQSIEKINQVTSEEVMQVAKKVPKPFIYAYRGEKND